MNYVVGADAGQDQPHARVVPYVCAGAQGPDLRSSARSQPGESPIVASLSTNLTAAST